MRGMANTKPQPERPASLGEMPFFERGLFYKIAEQPDGWAWRIADLTLPWPGCGRTAVTSGVERLKEWGYLRVERQGLGPRKGFVRRAHTYPAGDAPIENRATKQQS